MENARARVVFNPGTMACWFQPSGKSAIKISAATPAMLTVADLKQDPGRIEWSLPEQHLHIVLQLELDVLTVRFAASQPCSFTWPHIVDPAIKAWALPLDEGAFVPSDDARWIKHLAGQGALDTTADLGRPFWGLCLDGAVISVILPNPFNNELRFEDIAGRLGASLTHQFTRLQKVKEYAVQFPPGRRVSGRGSTALSRMADRPR